MLLINVVQFSDVHETVTVKGRIDSPARDRTGVWYTKFCPTPKEAQPHNSPQIWLHLLNYQICEIPYFETTSIGLKFTSAARAATIISIQRVRFTNFTESQSLTIDAK